MEDGGAFGFFEVEAGFAGLFARRLAVGVEGVEALGVVGEGACCLGWDVERGTLGVGDEGPAMPDSDALRVGLESVGVAAPDRDVGCGIRLRLVFCVVRELGVSLRSSEGEETEPFGCGWTASV